MESIGMVTRQEVQRERVANTRLGYPQIGFGYEDNN
jgi:hypothetical protein